MRKTLNILLILTVAVLTLAGSPLDAGNDMEGVLKLANYASWPDGVKTMRIMMAPQSQESYKTANTFLNNCNFNDMPIELQPYDPASSFDDISIIYIESQSGIDMEALAKKLANRKILTITNDAETLRLGCMFYIKYTAEMLDYQYNKQAVINSGLLMHASVMAPSHCMSL